MAQPVGLHPFGRRIGITVDAPVGTGIVRPHIDARRTAAPGTLSRSRPPAHTPYPHPVARPDQPVVRDRFRAEQGGLVALDRQSQRLHQRLVIMRQPGHERLVHTPAVLHAPRRQIRRLGTGLQPKAPPAVQFGQSGSPPRHLLRLPFAPAATRSVQPPTHLAVRSNVRKTEHQPFGGTVQPIADAGRTLQQLLHPQPVRNHQRIGPPDDPLRPQPVGQAEKSLHAPVQRRHAGFQLLPNVIVERILHIAVQTAAVQLIQPGEQRCRILRPEDNEPGGLIGDTAPPTVERIAAGRIAGPQPPEEPVGIKGRQITPATGRHDDRPTDRHPAPVSAPHLLLLFLSHAVHAPPSPPPQTTAPSDAFARRSG